MWVIAEQENGQLMNVTFELLGAAKELCAKLEEKCCAVLVNAAAGELPQQLIAAGADGIAIDGTKRDRYDNTPLDVFIHQIKEKYPDIFLVADVSTLEEGLFCYKNGVDIIGTTLSGYTPYSKNPIKFGTIPAPDPDYELISELRKSGVEKVIAEGRINDGYKMKKCLDAGAFAVVIGTSITEPKKIVKTILNNCNERR